MGSLGDLKMIRDGLLEFGLPWRLSGILSYLYSGLLFALAFSFLLKPEWRRPAAMLAMLCVAVLLIAVVRDALGGGAGCKGCPSAAAAAAAPDLVRIIIVFTLRATVLLLAAMLLSGDNELEVCVQ